MHTEYFPQVIQVCPLEDYRVLIYFSDGKIVEIDMSEELVGPVFEPLHDKELFRNSCCVANGTLAWDIEGTRDLSQVIDIDPLVLYDLPNVNAQWANAG